ncbi:dipeptide/oligopeptide/nickel ABC transporter permease/ATP-binding protein [Tessaracoccus sp. MC1627]|uniref:dipeptide/oligopeptide/nickel ABC transporter permease/ATP-binding protein n=1 Tax=Tessaracoccus sp. MC1627 TaxID=2760312 RepID=UPI001602C72D|nr:dipeptide/oligopeptide/nickel ABC transporter permease/ATP-binding protein [Tessaracoccus sp. MC1627]MBB1513334.1 dipeptide/oligopeptide/nickel ABC transporter permease/ATP-binding protein [Tessaracoccus sp. MC1627]
MTTTTTPLDTGIDVDTRGVRRHLLRRLLVHPLGSPALIFLLLIAVIAVLGPFIAPNDPSTTSLRHIFAPVGGEYLLGGDSAGRDVFSRLLVATTFSIAGGLLVAAVASTIGVTAGLIAGYFGGWVDSVGSWFTALTMSLPSIIVLIAARAVLGPSMWLTMAIFGAFVSPVYYRVVYNSVRAVRNELYVDAARTSGLSTTRIIGRHILLAVRAPVILLTSGIIAAGIGMQAGFDFLGLGDPTTPTWGQVLNEGFYNINRSALLVLWPSLVLGLTLVALTLLGTAIRDELEGTGEPRRRRAAAWQATEPAPEPLVHREDAGDTLLEVDGLAIAYEGEHAWTTVVHDARLSVARGTTHGLVGESGSGKTQTAFAVLGLLPAGGRIVAGSVTFDGQELVGMSYDQLNRLRGHRIAYVPQEPMTNLDPSFTVGSQLTDPLVIVLGMSRTDAKERALSLLEKVGIPDPQRTYDSYPHQLSGGMAQRVLIAGAVASHPDLLIADEPTTALDVTVQAEVLDLLRDLQEELGMAILLVTHNFGVVADICDHVSVMRQGVIVETGPTVDVFRNPQHPYTQSLFDAIPAGAPRAPLPGVTSSGDLGTGSTR